MMEPFVEGYVTGLALIIFVGPVLFVLLGATLEQGRASGLAVATGVFVSDILAVGITVLGFAELLTAPGRGGWLALLGGALLLVLGVGYLLKEPPRLQHTSVSAHGLAGLFAKGFLVNFVNPFVFTVWLGIVAAAGARHGTGVPLFLFLTGTVLAIFTTDTIKVFLAGRMKYVLKPRVLKWVYRSSGTLMCLFGLRLIFTHLT